MNNCPECKDSILNKQKSIIPDPKCVDDCPLEVSCNGISTYSDCVGVTVTLPCINTPVNESLTVVLQEMDEKLCEANTNICTSKISDSDNCCGYLEDKIVGGEGITVTTESGVGGCETIVISEKCWEWNNFTNQMYNTGWRNFNNGYQAVQYSNVKECTVHIRGVAFAPNYASEFTNGIIGTLPVGFRPTSIRSYPIVVNSASPNGYFPGFVEITTNGLIILKLLTNVSGYKELRVPLELRFEIN